jgi:hypothetical protein
MGGRLACLEDRADLGPKTIFTYADMELVFEKDRLTDVQ